MDNPHKGRTGLDRLVRATGYSMQGLRAAYVGESAFRQEFWTAVVLLPAAFWVGRTWTETVLLAGSVMLLLIVELLNSSVEAVVDRVSFEVHPLAKRAKDIASAAVFLSVGSCAALWLSALWLRWSA
jgi:diacylglycerol kinase (ATP)